MPARRFWSMQSQISRIRAEADLRSVNVGISLTNEEALDKTINMLVLELGETTEVQRSIIVKGDPNRGAKFAKVMGG